MPKALSSLLMLLFASATLAAERPNILWVTSEDNGPQLGCYGDAYAETPHLDALAARGLLYLNAWSNAPVCAPARTTIITGMYPPSFGGEHMRSATRLPDEIRLFPEYLRSAGYYCTNNVKEDYNLIPRGPVWDESSNRAHWRNRGPDQPFFAVFNFTTSHESQIRKRPHEPVHDPAGVRVPAYHPDTPEVRRDWAQYYDKLTEMDAQVGGILSQLAEDGLADETIVVYFGDHGPGMPRCKRWPYDSGLRVPLIVRFPEKYRALATDEYRSGGRSERLVSFVDLAPTMLSLAGVEIPAHMQGEAFLGRTAREPRAYVYGFRGRMDERVDMVRSIRDGRYVYLRHFLPHRRYGEHVAYMFETPTTRVWHQLFEQGRLTPEQARFWQTKPAEELYDLAADPDEVRDLAASPEHQETLRRFRQALHRHLIDSHDAGFLPEPMLHARAGSGTVYELARDEARYPLKTILAEAEAATQAESPTSARTSRQLGHADEAVRYWSIVGLLAHAGEGVPNVADDLRRLLRHDPSDCVRIVAAEALGRYGAQDDLATALPTLLEYANVERHGAFTAILALNALDALGAKADSIRDDIARLPVKHPSLTSGVRMANAIENLVAHLTRTK